MTAKRSPALDRIDLKILAALQRDGRQSIQKLSASAGLSARACLERVRRLFTQAQVFVKAEKLVEKYRARAEAVADDIEPTELRELLYYLVDSVLDRQPPPPVEPVVPPLLQLTV